MSTVSMPEPRWAGLDLQQLVVPAVQGLPGARAAILRLVRPMVLQYCRPRLRGLEGGLGSAEDVTQEVCVAVLQSLPRYVPRQLPFKSFVLGIASNKIADAFRAQGRVKAHPVADLPEPVVETGGPEDLALHHELVETLGELLERLSPRRRQVLRLRLLMGLTAAETAAIVGSTEGAVRVEQHRALERMRELGRELLDSHRGAGADLSRSR